MIHVYHANVLGVNVHTLQYPVQDPLLTCAFQSERRDNAVLNSIVVEVCIWATPFEFNTPPVEDLIHI